MATLYIEQKFWSLWGKFEVLHADGSLAFTVQGQPSWTKNLIVYNSQGIEAGQIKQVFWSWLPKFEIYENGTLIGEVKKDFTLLKPRYQITYGNWTAQGNLTGWNYSVTDENGNLIGTISQQIWHLTDHYVLTCAARKDELRLLLLVLSIDAANASQTAAASAARA